MAEPDSGLLRAGIDLANRALRGDATLRVFVLVTAVCVALASSVLAALVADMPLPPGKWGGVSPRDFCSPRLFAALFLPAEFLIYDYVLGRPMRPTLAAMWLDWRLARLVWAGLKASALLVAPVFAAGLVMAGVFVAGGKKPPLSLLLPVILLLLAAFGVMVWLSFRLMYLALVVARREPREVRSALAETRGRVWRILCALFLPFLAFIVIDAVASALDNILGAALEPGLGRIAGWLPGQALHAFILGWAKCAWAAVFALSYRRVVREGGQAGQGGFAFTQANGAVQGPSA